MNQKDYIDSSVLNTLNIVIQAGMKLNAKASLHEAYAKAKLEFRLHFKFVEKEKANKRFKRPNDLFKSDINGFWREIKKIQKLKQLINVPLKEIKTQYEKLFNTSNFPDDDRDKDERQKLNEEIN